MHKEYIAGPGCARKRRARPLLHMGHNISWRSSKTYEHNMKRERQTDRQRKSQRNRKRREGGGGGGKKAAEMMMTDRGGATATIGAAFSDKRQSLRLRGGVVSKTVCARSDR